LKLVLVAIAEALGENCSTLRRLPELFVLSASDALPLALCELPEVRPYGEMIGYGTYKISQILASERAGAL
jgi:hypothetical protein